VRILSFSRDVALLAPEAAENEAISRQRRYAELLGQERWFVVMGRGTPPTVRTHARDRVHVAGTGGGSAIARLGAAIRLGTELARRVAFDAIEYQDPEFTGWAAWRVAARLGRPLGGGVFNDRVGNARWIGRSLRRGAIDLGAHFLLRRTRIVRTDAQAMAARLEKLGVRRVAHVPFFIPGLAAFGVSTQQIDRRLARWTEDPLILSVARLEREKGHETLLAAFARAVAATGRGCLQLAGAGPREKELRRLAVRLGVADRIRWLGEVAFAALPDLFRAAQIFAHASFSDTAPRVLVLAQAARLPSVATKATGCDEIVADGEDGFLVPPEAPEVFSDRLTRFLANRDLYETMTRSGPFSAPARHGEGSITGPLQAYYTALVDG
jgi:glycosyltransferase involved in cell wall biosynthesis